LIARRCDLYPRRRLVNYPMRLGDPQHGAAEGFTFIELLIVTGIILTIAAMALPSLKSAIDQARVARAVGDINALQSDIAAYDAVNGSLPKTLADIGRGTLLDPWHNPYQYLNLATTKNGGAMRKDRFLVP